jgi:thiamine pyrophosphate-dependent acetolactate synthase large subunit-like protein
LEIRDGEIYVGVAEAPHVRTVSDAMVETMVRWGVKHVFGMVGHSNLGLADALRRAEEAGELRYIGIRHEGAAAFAASAYGKLTGRPAACLTIAGPGATNLLTGLWDAKVDRAPVLALTGQVQTQVLGPGAFQEVDLSAAFAAVTGWSQPVLRDSNPVELMNLACKHALLKREVAHLVFPDEVQTLPSEAEPGGPDGRLASLRIAPPAESMEQAQGMLERSERPVIIVGHGAREHMPEVTALAEQLGAPVITTFKAKGQIGDDHPLAAGVLGRSGTPVASWIMNEADLLLVLGASFSNHTGIYAGHPIIQVDFDPLQLGKFHAVDCPVWGEVGVVVAQLRAALGTREDDRQRAQLAERWAIWRAEKASRAADDRGHGVNSAAVFAALSRRLPEDAVIAVDVGNHAYSFGRYFECRRHTVLMSGYLGSIGFGYPAAIGAWAAAPERPVVAVTGDGGFAQYMAELTTAVKHGMNITHVLLNNGQLGKISKEQRAGEWDVWQTALHNPDFSAFARNCGALGLRVTDSAALDDAIAEAVAYDGPAMVEVMADPDLI